MGAADRQRARARAPLALTALLTGALVVAAPGPGRAEVVSAEARIEGGKPRPGAVSDVPNLRLGAPVTLVLTVTAPAGAQVFVPSNPALGPFKRLGASAPAPTSERQSADDPVVEVRRLTLLPVRLGAEAIPPIEVPYRLADGSSGTASTGRVRVHVQRRLANEGDPKLGPAPPPVPVIARDWALIWVLTTLGAALVAALITWVLLFAFRQRLALLKPPPPPRPANEVALEELALIAHAELDPDVRHARTTDVLRAYLGARYGFEGLESTTRELMTALGGVDLKGILPAEIRELLDDADLVKFARFAPDGGSGSQRIDRVRRIVEETWEPPEPDEDLALQVHHESAAAPERFKAAAIDVALLGGMSLLVLAGLWAVALIDWGWIALVVFGLLLTLRDAFPLGSPGKAMMHLDIVRRDERQSAPSALERVLRNVPLLLAPVGLPVEALVLVYHPLRHRLGDLWAGTEVVRVPQPVPAGPPVDVEQAAAAGAAGEGAR